MNTVTCPTCDGKGIISLSKETPLLKIISKKKLPDYKRTSANHCFYNTHFKESYRHDIFSFLDCDAYWLVGVTDDIEQHAKTNKITDRHPNEIQACPSGKCDL